MDAIAAEISTETAFIQVGPIVERVKLKSRSPTASLKASKDEIRTSLKASTLDGVFATLFSNVTGGVLLTNFLLELGASPTEIGVLASIPMLANLMQPIGAYFSEQTNSRHDYCFWVYSISRSLWVGLAIAIFLVGRNHAAPNFLIEITLGVAIFSYFLGALGSAPWLSWMAALVPRSLRGRYFGLRSSAANLTNLISMPLLGFVVSRWQGGSIQGYSVVLILGVVSGLVSLCFQNFMVDVNPQSGQEVFSIHTIEADDSFSQPTSQTLFQPISLASIWQDSNFLKFLVYVNLWTFSVNLSAPFFNVYLLNDLALDISQVTLYNSLSAGANLLLLMFWGKLADRIGNRPILIGVGIVFAIFPIFWLMTGTNPLSTWVWLPLLHLIAGATAAAIDLCSNNFQMGIAPHHNQSTYFGIAAAFAGISGALGTTAGGFFAQLGYGGLLGLFAFSSVLRLGALLPLIFVQERQLPE
ncbi:MFS transporter [Neosynechococcus sphagnicola sy1]|uniref:MFS transporter n=1 Tax=Neosynechococcus sphagnicola sy1 TaxID=1497020 RepID=A0A098TI52_9CYAN|nr:MFS transporter [Neosynechococcus sphagnicola sy1]